MAVSKQPYIQIQLVYIGSLPKVHKLRVCVPPPPPPPPPTHTHFLWHLPTPVLSARDAHVSVPLAGREANPLLRTLYSRILAMYSSLGLATFSGTS